MKNKTPCKQTECRMFIDFEEEYNCTLVSIWENGPMTLRQIGERIGVSFARIKQIETKALKKMRKNRLLM
jgi:DNA-directed RNA polymerase sigma subunit (sigma70/sigma32)